MFLGLLTVEDMAQTDVPQDLKDNMTKPELAIITNAFKNLKTKLPGIRLKLTCDTSNDAVTLGNWKGIPSKNTYTQQPLPISSLSINNIVM